MTIEEIIQHLEQEPVKMAPFSFGRTIVLRVFAADDMAYTAIVQHDLDGKYTVEAYRPRKGGGVYNRIRSYHKFKTAKQALAYVRRIMPDDFFDIASRQILA